MDVLLYIDAEWASNACFWQWVAESFSNKQYFANQDNINHYTGTVQKNTLLDIPYEDFPLNLIPVSLKVIISV